MLSKGPIERVHYFVLIAIRITASSVKAISPKQMIRITGTAPLVSKYLWTSLLLLGEILPNRFDEESIFISSLSSVDTQAEQGYFSKFGSNSLYETEFKRFLNEFNMQSFLKYYAAVIVKKEVPKLATETLPTPVHSKTLSVSTCKKLDALAAEQAELQPFLDFDSAIDLRIHKHERVCTIGMNGVSKDKNSILKCFAQLLVLIPPETTFLRIRIDVLDIFDESDVTTIATLLSDIPKQVTELECIGKRAPTHALIYSNLPQHVVSITLNVNTSHIPNRDVNGVLLKLFLSFPVKLSSLDLISSSLGEMPFDKLVELVKALPSGLKSLRLTHNRLDMVSRLDELIQQLPKSLIELDISNNGIDGYTPWGYPLPLNIEVFTTEQGKPQRSPPLAEKLAKLEAEQQAKRQAAIPALNKALLARVKEFDVTTREIDDLLDSGADINYQAKSTGFTALMIAIDSSNDRIAEYLLNSGANPSLKNNKGNTASKLASSSSTIFQLIQKKETLDRLQKRPQAAPTTATPAGQLNIDFYEEIISPTPQTKKIKSILKRGANINYQDEDGYTAVMLAVDNQNDRIAEYLLNEGADPLLKNTYGEIASDLASRHSPIFAILKGYELIYASLMGQLSLVKEFLKSGGAIDFQGPKGYTPLLIAAEEGMFELVEFLLSQGADLTLTLKDGRGIFDLVTEQAILDLLESHNYASEPDDYDSQSELFAPSQQATQPTSKSVIAPDYSNDSDDKEEDLESESIPLELKKKAKQRFFPSGTNAATAPPSDDTKHLLE